MIAAADGEAGARLKSSVALLALVSLFPLAAGYCREATVAFALGTSRGADAFAVALLYVDGFAAVAAIGVASYTLVPVFAAMVAEGRPADGYRLVETAALWLFSVMAPLIIAGTLAPRWIAGLITPGFTPEQTALLARLVPAATWAAALILVTAVVAGNLQARSLYAWPVVGRALLAVSIAVGVLARIHADPIKGAAIGLVVGAAAQLTLQLWRLWKTGWRPRRPRWMNRDLSGVLHTALPALGATLLTQVLMGGAQSWLGSGLSEGSLAAVNYALRTINLVSNLTLAIATVSLTELSLSLRRGSALNSSSLGLLADSLETGVFLLVPLVAAMLVWGEPLLRVLFMRGHYDAGSLERTAGCLRWYTLSVLPGFLNAILLRTQLALGRPWDLLAIAIAWVAATAGATALLLVPLGAEALPAGALVGQLVACAAGVYGTRSFVGAALPRQLGGYTLRVAGLAVAATLVAVAAESLVGSWLGASGGRPDSLLLHGAAGATLLLTYGGLCAWLKDRHLRQFADEAIRFLRLRSPAPVGAGPATAKGADGLPLGSREWRQP